MGAVMGTFSSLQTKQRRPSKGKTSCFAFLASSVYLLGEKCILGREKEMNMCHLQVAQQCLCEVYFAEERQVGCEVVEEMSGYEDVAVEGLWR